MKAAVLCLTFLLCGSVRGRTIEEGRELGNCMVDSGEAVSDALDAALFIWASYQRCNKVGQQMTCAVDISNTVKSINSMLNVILRVADKCNALNSANKECGLAAGRLTEHIAGLSGSSAQIAKECVPGSSTPAVATGNTNSKVMCSVDVKNSAKSLFEAIQALRNNEQCGVTGSKSCSIHILDIMGALTGFGQFIAGSVGQCKAAAAKGVKIDPRMELCSQAAISAVEYSLKVAKSGLEMSRTCGAGVKHKYYVPGPNVPHRLFEEDKQIGASGSSTVNVLLGAMLPAFAVLGFYGGRAYSSRRSQWQECREVLSDNE